MPYVQPSRLAITGTLTADDKVAIMETLAAAGIDTNAIVCVIAQLGNVSFLRNVPSGQPNLIHDGELLDQIANALDAAGWVLWGRHGRESGGLVEVLGRPTPRELWTVEDVAQFLEVKAASARGQLSRWGLAAHDYQRSASGRPQGRFDAELVRVLADARPGQGARTDRALSVAPDSVDTSHRL